MLRRRNKKVRTGDTEKYINREKMTLISENVRKSTVKNEAEMTQNCSRNVTDKCNNIK